MQGYNLEINWASRGINVMTVHKIPHNSKVGGKKTIQLLTPAQEKEKEKKKNSHRFWGHVISFMSIFHKPSCR